MVYNQSTQITYTQAPKRKKMYKIDDSYKIHVAMVYNQLTQIPYSQAPERKNDTDVQNRRFL